MTKTYIKAIYYCFSLFLILGGFFMQVQNFNISKDFFKSNSLFQNNSLTKKLLETEEYAIELMNELDREISSHLKKKSKLTVLN